MLGRWNAILTIRPAETFFPENFSLASHRNRDRGVTGTAIDKVERAQG